MDFLSVSWKQLHEDIFSLAQKIEGSGETFDLIVAIARGGMTIAQILSDFLSLPVATFTISSYKDLNQNKPPNISYHLGGDITNKRILLVDDISDSGKTFVRGLEYLKSQGISLVKTAAPFVKPNSIYYPDFFIKKTGAWIVFPFEIKETIVSVSNVMKKENKTKDEITEKLKSLNIEEKYIQLYLK